MSATAYTPGRRWVAEDLDGMPDDGFRREVIDGVLLVSPAPFVRHQTCVHTLDRTLGNARSRDTRVLPAPTDWRPGNGDCFEPDLMVVRHQDRDLDDHLRKTPLLVVEVLSHSTSKRDRLVKRAAYEAHGVPAYWIIDPHEPSISALQLDDHGMYVEVAHASRDEAFRAAFPFPVEIVPAELLE